MFESRTLLLLQAENAALRGQVSDLHSEISKIHREWSQERKDLIDRIMALTNPLAVREVARASGVPSSGMQSAATEDKPVRRNWPPSPLPDSRPKISLAEKDKQMMARAVSIEEASSLERSVGS